MIRQHRTLAQGCAVLVTAGLLATGCSSSKSSGPSATTPTTTSAAPATTSTASGDANGPADAASAKAAIEKLYTDYYDSTKSSADKVALVQGGDKMKPILDALVALSKGQTSSATVTDVSFSSPTHANVLFTISLNGTPVLKDTKGQALLDSTTNTWQVADVTLCTLAGLGGVDKATLTGAGCP